MNTSCTTERITYSLVLVCSRSKLLVSRVISRKFVLIAEASRAIDEVSNVQQPTESR